MSDATDAVAEAIALNRKLAASKLVRKDELTAEIARAKARGADTAALEAELAGVVAEAEAAVAEIKELQRMGSRARSLAPLSPGGGGGGGDFGGLLDPEEQALHTENALEKARAHIKELDAQAGLGGPPPETTSSSAPRTQTREEADAEARAQFEKLKEQARNAGKKTL